MWADSAATDSTARLASDTRDVKRWALNTVLIVNSNNRTTIGSVNNNSLTLRIFLNSKPPEGLRDPPNSLLGLRDPSNSLFWQESPLFGQKMAPRRWLNIDGTCHHHISDPYDLSPEACSHLILRRQRRREQNFGPDTLFWKVLWLNSVEQHEQTLDLPTLEQR